MEKLGVISMQGKTKRFDRQPFVRQWKVGTKANHHYYHFSKVTQDILQLQYFINLFFSYSSRSDKAYPLKLESETIPVYCHLTSLGTCGDGGWTLVMKVNGSKVSVT